MSSKQVPSSAGSQPAFLAQSSQNGEPVSGEKCHCTISRTCASSFSWADLMVAESGFISDFIGQALAAGVGNELLAADLFCEKYLSIVARLSGRGSTGKTIKH